MSIVAKSGRPGESAKIRIRGTNTLTGDAEPLWVIDGVPLQRNIPSIEKGRIKRVILMIFLLTVSPG